jgi:hypothetical protein
VGYRLPAYSSWGGDLTLDLTLFMSNWVVTNLPVVLWTFTLVSTEIERHERIQTVYQTQWMKGKSGKKRVFPITRCRNIVANDIIDLRRWSTTSYRTIECIDFYITSKELSMNLLFDCCLSMHVYHADCCVVIVFRWFIAIVTILHKRNCAEDSCELPFDPGEDNRMSRFDIMAWVKVGHRHGALSFFASAFEHHTWSWFNITGVYQGSEGLITPAPNGATPMVVL